MTTPATKPTQFFDAAIEAGKKGDLQQAHYCLTLAVRDDWENPTYQRELGKVSSILAFTANGLHQQAISCCQRACILEPNNADNWISLGNVANAACVHDLAICALERAAQFGMNLDNIYSAIGHLYAKTYRRSQAMVYYGKALKENPDHTDTHYLLGCMYIDENMDAEKFAYHCEKGTQVTAKSGPQTFIKASKWNAAVGLLKLGKFEKGLELLEARNETKEMGAYADNAHARFASLPQWDGQHGKKVVVLSEWGHGDMMQFCRYIPLMVEERGCEVLVEARGEVKPLLESSFAGMPVKVAKFPLQDNDLKEFGADSRILTMSLPYAFRTRYGTIPHNIPYLKPSDEKLQQWHVQVPKHHQPRIGICWSGERRTYDANLHRIDAMRSIDFVEAERLMASLPSIEWVSLQLGERGKAFPMQEGVKDFSDTAAIIRQLDAVVSVDTSIVHLAGGMGKPVFMLSRYDGCWRWLTNELTDSPWYPSLHIFRQKKFNDWSDPMQELHDALKAKYVK